MTTILTKKKDTAGAPAPGDLTNSAGGAELAVNTATKRLYTKDSGGNVVEIGTNPSDITAASITDTGLTSGRVTYATTGGLLTDSANLTFNGTTLTANALSTTGITDSGNLIFTGTGNRITGDFSNATQANKVAFQTSTTNGATVVAAIPNGSSTISQLRAYNGTDPDNSAWIGIVANGLSQAQLNSGITGTGTYLPMTFYTGGSERLRILTDGKVGIGTTTPAVSLAISSTDAVLLPKGTTAQQPTGVAGYLRFNTDTSQFEGYNGTAWSSVGGAAISNDTSTATNIYPISASATSGTALTVYTSNAKFLYKPSTGELQASEMVATNGLFVNATSIAASYTIASGYNAQSVGPVTIASGQSVTITSGQRWLVY